MRKDRFPIDSSFGWAQREYLAEIERQYNSGQPVRIIVLKARQLGISTATEGVLFNWGFIHPGTNGLVIAHQNEPAASLFEKTKLFWEEWPFRHYYNLRYATRREMHWLETRSTLKVATARNLGTGRGSTFHAVHASECAFYDDPKTLMTGLANTIPRAHGTIVVLESTANGFGNWFHEQWEQAETGDSDYAPLFFPWYKHFEYSLPTTLSTKHELDPDEKELLKLGATYENIAWRRWAIPNVSSGSLDSFMQEYPATPEEAFITSGNPIFQWTKLKESYEQAPHQKGRLVDTWDGAVEFVHDPTGPFTVFKRPSKSDTRYVRYFCAGDPSMTVDGDPACIQVIHRGTFEQVAVWHGRVDPLSFADEMIKIGKYYNECTLCPEVEGGGQSTVARILTRNYPNVWKHRWADKAPGKVSLSYGWSTNWQRKSWSVGTLQKLVLSGSITIHDKDTFDQMQDYVTLPNGEWGPSSPKSGMSSSRGYGIGYDDAVMALAIACTASITEGPFREAERDVQAQIVDLYGWQEPGLPDAAENDSQY